MSGIAAARRGAQAILPPVKSRRSVHRLRVAYFDTDTAQVVHHASYLRFFEVARIEYFRDHGFDYARFEKETGLGLPVVEAKLRYRAPARFDDLLEIETWTGRASRASVWLDAAAKRDGVVLCESTIRLACTHIKEGTVRKIPDALLDAVLEPGHGI